VVGRAVHEHDGGDKVLRHPLPRGLRKCCQAARDLAFPFQKELHSRIRKLDPRPGEILHATYAGPRHPASDVENLLLYNVDMDGACFRHCAKSGVRFELAPRALREPLGELLRVSPGAGRARI
jgi:hypothetical protein